ncbi:s-layer domain [Fusarium albosuccineum]|uniref:S-layer domain n=1 Tax=Fusarium albosuccineum TaxID=1237068 RepID=A0A8H4NVL0_9HYPO|nr:s-layer domain [Fusarium albosuccineum]
MSAPAVSFANNLDFSVTVYDSFSTQDQTNYFGTLTSLATVPAKTTASVQLIHSTSVLIASNATTNYPLARLIYIPGLKTGPFSVGPANVNAMAQTMDFITLINKNGQDPLALAFHALWKDPSKPPVPAVDQFFSQHPTYASCTFATYMMGILYKALQPESKEKPLDQAVYLLSTLVALLGGTWPSELPEIVVTKFTCNTHNDVLAIQAGIDLKKLPARSDEALQFFGSLFDVQQLQVAISINYAVGLNVLGTRLSISLDAMHVPFGPSATLAINKPTVTIDITPVFGFVVFTVAGSIPFNIFGKAFDADVTMVIDNIEASFDVVIKGDDTSLPAPPVMHAVHFDTFGVGIGIIFAPPSAAIGLSGQLHIGDSVNRTPVALDDDTFVIVCQLAEEVPNPLYISFYVPQMQLTDVLTVFTNTRSSLDVPVSFTDLSFHWAEEPLQPVVLPDGSLSNIGYGFSAAANILDFSFFGDVQISLDSGLTADIEMAPLVLGSVLSIRGNGTGVSVMVDASGNPIKHNQLVAKAAQQQALKGATPRQLVPQGGPVLRLQTSASPFLHLNGAVSLFEVENVQLDAHVTPSGIKFEVDFGGLLTSGGIVTHPGEVVFGPPPTSKMSCTLADFHNLAASFEYGINDTISLPSIGGVSLGSIPLQASVAAHFSSSTSSSDMILQVGGSFDFEGSTRSFGDFTADAHIQAVSDLLSAIVTNIEQDAGRLFGDLLSTGAAWASKLLQGVITAIDSVASVLQNAFDQGAEQIASIMNDLGFDLEDIARGLSDAFRLSPLGVAQAMRQGGCVGQEVAGALKAAFGGDAGQIASALQGAYGFGAYQIRGMLGQIGFDPNQIGQAFQELGGDFAQVSKSILHDSDSFSGFP